MIDLCVVNYNTRPLLQRFLDSLHSDLKYSAKLWKLYITDNHSTDDSRPWLEENGSNYQIDKIYAGENIGYSAACNVMARYSDSDIICLLNADVWLTSSDIAAVQKIFDMNPNIHILGPKQRDESGRITHAGIVGTNKKPKHRGWREYDPDDIYYKDRIECVTVSGSAYFIRRGVWDSLTYNDKYQEMYPNAYGAFLPTPHYFEETWCSYFARYLGYNVVYDGTVSIGHSWHASSPKPGEGYSHADAYFKTSQEIFRKACDYIGIERD